MMKDKFLKKFDKKIKDEFATLKAYIEENIVKQIEEIDITTADEATLEKKDYLETSFHYLNEILRAGWTIRTSIMHWDAFKSFVK